MPPLLYNRASLRAEINDSEGAMADLDYVLDIDPTLVPARLLRASLRLDAQDLDGSAEDAHAGLREKPDDPALLSVLAMAQHAAGELEEALASFDRALAADPGFVPALGDRAVLALELGDGASALRDLTSAVALAGDDPDLRFNRGFVLAHLDRPEEAVQEFTAALDLPGADQPELLAQRALCLQRLGRDGEAAADVEALRDLDGERAAALEAGMHAEVAYAA
jgi:tetratricopeptide (TPR) repeat protein